jgi:hypothetical protein
MERAMPDTGSWRTHSQASTGAVVLAVDFPLAGRPEAGFADFAPLLGGEVGVWETLPPVVHDARAICLDDYLGSWLDQLRPDRPRVRAVLSFCAGSAFVPALVAGIAQWQERAPAVIAFDPETPAPLTLHMQYWRAIERFAPLLSKAELAAARDTARELYLNTEMTIAEVRLAVRAHLHDVSAAGFERAGLPPKHRAELLAAFDSFACYLVAGAAAVADGQYCEFAATNVIAISSNTPTNGLNLVPEEQRGGLAAKEFRFDIAHSELLRRPETAAAVAELLA